MKITPRIYDPQSARASSPGRQESQRRPTPREVSLTADVRTDPGPAPREVSVAVDTSPGDGDAEMLDEERFPTLRDVSRAEVELEIEELEDDSERDLEEETEENRQRAADERGFQDLLWRDAMDRSAERAVRERIRQATRADEEE